MLKNKLKFREKFWENSGGLAKIGNGPYRGGYRKISQNLSEGVDELTTAIYNIASNYCTIAGPRLPLPPRPRRPSQSKSVFEIRLALRKCRRKLRHATTRQPELIRELRRLLNLKRRAEQADAYEKESKLRAAEGERYLKNPWQYIQKLGRPPLVQPTFTQEVAEQYLTEALDDRNYAVPFTTPDWAPPPPVPATNYEWFEITNRTIDLCLRKRSNSSSPGPDGIPYTIYKRCSSLIPYLKHVFREQQRKQTTAASNGLGIAKMIYKKPSSPDEVDPTANPANFRRICLSNTIGKLFMGMLNKSLGGWAVSSGIINTYVQKGFIANLSGCVEHSQHVAAALRDAREHQRQIILLFFDLKAAFDNVAHNLIMWALHRYNVPVSVQRLIQQHYASLYVCMQTASFQTMPIRQLIGIMQGDTISGLIFNLATNLLVELAYDEQLANYAYTFKETNHLLLPQLLADDLLLSARTVEGAQRYADAFMRAYTFMRCIVNTKKSLVMALGSHHIEGKGSRYAQFDPKIIVNGVALPCVGVEGIKYLGRRLYYTLSLDQPKQLLTDKIAETIAKLDSSHLPSTHRCHALKLLIPCLVNWEFAMYPFSHTFVSKLDAIVKRALKRWLSLPPGTTMHAVNLPTSMRGLGIPDLITLFEQRQVGTFYSLLTSSDLTIRALGDMEENRLRSSHRWTVLPMIHDYLDHVGEENSTAKGLNAWVRDVNVNKRWEKLSELTVQNKALVALEKAGSDDKTWIDSILGLPSHLFQFQTRALLDVLPTNANLFRWKKRSNAQCELCHRKATTQHILNNCTPCLDKYRWRHDSVLRVIADFCDKHLTEGSELWVDLPAREHARAMGGAPPPHLLQTQQRPDLIIANVAKHTLAIIELTVPSEHNARDAKLRKTVRYTDLTTQARTAGWEVVFFTIEVCSRGIIPASNLSEGVNKLLSKALLLFSRSQVRPLLDMSARTALAGSYWIWTSRRSSYMPPTQPLLR